MKSCQVSPNQDFCVNCSCATEISVVAKDSVLVYTQHLGVCKEPPSLLLLAVIAFEQKGARNTVPPSLTVWEEGIGSETTYLFLGSEHSCYVFVLEPQHDQKRWQRTACPPDLSSCCPSHPAVLLWGQGKRLRSVLFPVTVRFKQTTWVTLNIVNVLCRYEMPYLPVIGSSPKRPHRRINNSWKANSSDLRIATHPSFPCAWEKAT